jgi:NAD(P)-dependent dehydrogenase (short-subunit alcohol dehydrogenase family)
MICVTKMCWLLNVLVTGGSRGLGLALAREFAGRGARVTICARDPEELLQAMSQLEHLGLKVESTSCDITLEANVAGLISELEDRNGPLDVLVNNAGRMPRWPGFSGHYTRSQVGGSNPCNRAQYLHQCSCPCEPVIA